MARFTELDKLEERVLERGVTGARSALSTLQSIGNALRPQGQSSIKTAWQGGTTIVFGIDPADNNFFVGTREVFNNPQKAAKSQSDVQKQYSGQIASQLADCFVYLDNVTDDVMQAQILFSNDKSTNVIDGKPMITFAPGGVIYAADPNSDIGRQISRAGLGIVIRGRFVGSNLQQMKAMSFDDSDSADPTNVFIGKDGFKNMSGFAKFTADEYRNYMGSINTVESNLQPASTVLREIKTAGHRIDVDKEFKLFMKDYVRKGIPNPNKAYMDFAQVLMNKYNNGIRRNRSLDAQNDKAFKYVEVLDYMNTNEKAFKAFITIYAQLINARNIAKRKFSTITGNNSFQQTQKGFKVTDPMGFVAVTSESAVKLVSDIEFDD